MSSSVGYGALFASIGAHGDARSVGMGLCLLYLDFLASSGEHAPLSGISKLDIPEAMVFFALRSAILPQLDRITSKKFDNASHRLLGFYCTMGDGLLRIRYSSGLQRIHLKFVKISAGPLNLRRFENLTLASLDFVGSWDVLNYLPDSLEEFQLNVNECGTDYTPEEKAPFPASKLPPKIRVWLLSYGCPRLLFDTPVPSTIEQISMTWQDEDIHVTMLLQKFASNLDRIKVLGIGNKQVPVSFYQHLPSIVLVAFPPLPDDDPEALKLLPRDLERLYLREDPSSLPLLLKNLPKTLKTFSGAVPSAESIAELPRELLNASLSFLAPASAPAGTLLDFPPKLTTLDLGKNFTMTKECLHTLPGTLEQLYFDIRSSTASSLSFPDTLKRSLREITISERNEEQYDRLGIAQFLTKFEDFSKLEELYFHESRHLVIQHDTLSKLPKSLTELVLLGIQLENSGLEAGKSIENADWSQAAFSRLPERLRIMKLSFHRISDDIDFNLFSMLPKDLSSLTLRTGKNHFADAKKFVDSLPRRLTYISHRFRTKNNGARLEVSSSIGEFRGILGEFRQALDEYYSDPFWGPNGVKFYERS